MAGDGIQAGGGGDQFYFAVFLQRLMTLPSYKNLPFAGELILIFKLLYVNNPFNHNFDQK